MQRHATLVSGRRPCSDTILLPNWMTDPLWRERGGEIFASVGTGTDEVQGDEEQQPTYCPGCRGHKPANRPEHNRIPGLCNHPLVETQTWSCPGCKRSPPRPRGHTDHTEVPGECRWSVADYKQHKGRKGVHPREATPPPAAAPSHADVRGPDLNPEPIGNPPDTGQSSSSASGSAPPPAPAERGGQDDEPPVGRRRRRVVNPREAQPTIVEQGTSMESDDWSSFDISTSLRTLRHGTPAQVLREVRKLKVVQDLLE